jgi:glycosyltransferase involved in cell wall biosynthesis
VLRIGVDVTAAVTGRTGIARYVTEVADGLAQSGIDVARFAIGRGPHRAPPGTRHVRVPLRLVDQAWTRWQRPAIDRIVRGLDSVHASGPLLPPATTPLVAVVQDVAPLDHPTLHPARDVDQLRRYVADLDRADAVITISGATGTRLLEAGVAPDRLHVVPIGLSELPPPVRSPLAGRRYVLAVGAPVPRKGLDTVLRAVGRLADDDVAVALVGPPGSEDDALASLAASLGLGDRVHRAGPVTEAELAGWYADAAVLAAPSVDEGFGLTVIEALSLGIPVVVSDIPAFREVTGGHARFVPVGDVEALADALADALDEPTGPDGQLERATAHARGYTWAACAEATLAVHRLVASA